MFSQEIPVPCPGQQRLRGDEEEESRGDGEGAERRSDPRARSASERGARRRGSVILVHPLTQPTALD